LRQFFFVLILFFLSFFSQIFLPTTNRFQSWCELFDVVQHIDDPAEIFLRCQVQEYVNLFIRVSLREQSSFDGFTHTEEVFSTALVEDLPIVHRSSSCVLIWLHLETSRAFLYWVLSWPNRYIEVFNIEWGG
jgi:hypothetical protein